MLDRLDRFQQRHAPVALPVAVSKRFGEHDGTRLAATVSYYSFFSVFPLMLVFVTVLGIVLEDNDDLREDLIDGAVGRIPVIGSQLADDTIPGSGWVLVLGLATAIWAGMAAVERAAARPRRGCRRARPRAAELRHEAGQGRSCSSCCSGSGSACRRCCRTLPRSSTPGG